MHAHHASTLQIRLSWTFFGLPWVVLSRSGGWLADHANRRLTALLGLLNGAFFLALYPHIHNNDLILGLGFAGVDRRRALAAVDLLADEPGRGRPRTLATPGALHDVQHRVARRWRGRVRLSFRDQPGAALHGHGGHLGEHWRSRRTCGGGATCADTSRRVRHRDRAGYSPPDHRKLKPCVTTTARSGPSEPNRRRG